MREPLRFSGLHPGEPPPLHRRSPHRRAGLRKHLRWLADTEGVTGIVANGHAAEVSSLSREERKRSLALALEEVRQGADHRRRVFRRHPGGDRARA